MIPDRPNFRRIAGDLLGDIILPVDAEYESISHRAPDQFLNCCR
jgi:hypothetical protein